MSVRDWAMLLLNITETTKEKNLAEEVRQFGLLLRTRRQARLLPRIINQFSLLWAEANNLTEIKTWGARELPAAIKNSLQELGSEVVIDHTIEPALIGGLKMQIGDVIIDGTVATRLKKLYETNHA